MTANAMNEHELRMIMNEKENYWHSSFLLIHAH